MRIKLSTKITLNGLHTFDPDHTSHIWSGSKVCSPFKVILTEKGMEVEEILKLHKYKIYQVIVENMCLFSCLYKGGFSRLESSGFSILFLVLFSEQLVVSPGGPSLLSPAKYRCQIEDYYELNLPEPDLNNPGIWCTK